MRRKKRRIWIRREEEMRRGGGLRGEVKISEWNEKWEEEMRVGGGRRGWEIAELRRKEGGRVIMRSD